MTSDVNSYRSSCQAMYSAQSVSTDPNEHYDYINAVNTDVKRSLIPNKDMTRSPIRKKPHIEIQKKDYVVPQGYVLSPDPMSKSCRYEKKESPSSSPAPQKAPLTLADCKIGNILLIS